jgi:hypothetical protein
MIARDARHSQDFRHRSPCNRKDADLRHKKAPFGALMLSKIGSLQI